jgi:hypothetical protein
MKEMAVKVAPQFLNILKNHMLVHKHLHADIEVEEATTLKL